MIRAIRAPHKIVISAKAISILCSLKNIYDQIMLQVNCITNSKRKELLLRRIILPKTIPIMMYKIGQITLNIQAGGVKRGLCKFWYQRVSPVCARCPDNIPRIKHKKIPAISGK